MGYRMQSHGFLSCNMEHCRFNNTFVALCECFDALDDGEILSNEEYNKAKAIFVEVVDFLEQNGVIDTDVDEDFYDRFDEFLENDIKHE